MSATKTATAREAVQLYLDGLADADAVKLERAFHPDARMFGSLAGDRVDIPIGEMIKLVVAQPPNAGGTFRGEITSVDEQGDMARAVVEEEGFWGSVSFVDYFSLARIDGDWRIVNKVFAHTGGTPPQP